MARFHFRLPLFLGFLCFFAACAGIVGSAGAESLIARFEGTAYHDLPGVTEPVLYCHSSLSLPPSDERGGLPLLRDYYFLVFADTSAPGDSHLGHVVYAEWGGGTHVSYGLDRVLTVRIRGDLAPFLLNGDEGTLEILPVSGSDVPWMRINRDPSSVQHAVAHVLMPEVPEGATMDCNHGIWIGGEADPGHSNWPVHFNR